MGIFKTDNLAKSAANTQRAVARPVVPAGLYTFEVTACEPSTTDDRNLSLAADLTSSSHRTSMRKNFEIANDSPAIANAELAELAACLTALVIEDENPDHKMLVGQRCVVGLEVRQTESGRQFNVIAHGAWWPEPKNIKDIKWQPSIESIGHGTPTKRPGFGRMAS